jgi:hypothetical protein
MPTMSAATELKRRMPLTLPQPPGQVNPAGTTPAETTYSISEHVAHPEQLFQRIRSAALSVARSLGLPDSAWQRVPMEVPPTAFGPGSRWQFAHYFEGESGVPVTSIDDIVAWLGTCEYASDAELFHEPDLWQQPCAFEQLQRGDCEDFALWAWRKLIEIGLEAEFFVGRVICDEPAIDRQHAWVVYRSGRDAYLFEPAARDRQLMIRPLEAVRDEYVPHFAVDRRFATSAFVGCILDSRREIGAT